MSVPELFGLSGPVYLRFMAKAVWCRPVEERRVAAESAFANDRWKPSHSFYRVSTEEETELVALSFVRSRKEPLKQSVTFFIFREEDIQAAIKAGGILSHTPGADSCDRTKRLHLDFVLDERAVEALCRSGLEGGRSGNEVSKDRLRTRDALAVGLACRASRSVDEAGDACTDSRCPIPAGAQ